MKNVIHFFGASGSGTSTLGKAICTKSHFTFMDTDDYLWMPTDPKYTVKRDANERIAMMQHDIKAANHVVIAGSLVGWGDVLISEFTLAVRLVVPTEIRINRLRKREFERFGERILPFPSKVYSKEGAMESRSRSKARSRTCETPTSKLEGIRKGIATTTRMNRG